MMHHSNRKLVISLATAAGLIAALALASSCATKQDATDAANEPVQDCSFPRPGCPCSEEGVKVVCGETVGKSAGQLVCGSGVARCTDGSWSSCLIDGENGTVTLHPGLDTQTQGSATPCGDPCDPYCNTFNDDPTGEGNGTDLVEGNGGLTLPGNTPPPIPPNCSGGTVGTCAHTPCEPGVALAASCDQAPPPLGVNGPPGGSCVSTVCASDPSCCSTSWTSACVFLAESLCNVTCLCNTLGTFLPCYNDNYDHDGDGYSGNDGDCYDCDPTMNAGAYDFVDTLDNDCNGTIDDEVATCDASLPLSSSDPVRHAKAVDICRETTPNATGAARTWGLIMPGSVLAQANMVSSPDSRTYGISNQFGNGLNGPFVGNRIAVYSSGTARYPGQPQYVNPNGQVSSYVAGTSCNYPAGFPANAAGCSAGWGNAHDSSGLHMLLRAPTNALSFSYNFRFFSSEYPEWVCTPYNDHFVAIMSGTQVNGNISFDFNGNPVSVNVGFFQIPGCPTCTDPVLNNTGYDGTCWGEICGGATDWLQSTAPVTAGEEFTLTWSIWDMSDYIWDSTTIIDAFTWSPETSTVDTTPIPPPSVTTFAPGTFVRDYDASGICPSGTSIRWTDWSWTTQTPGDSHIDFEVQTASTAAGLDAAPTDALQFSDPPGPSGLVGTPAVAHLSPDDTQAGAAVVDATLDANSRPRSLPFLRVITRLEPSSNQLEAPTLLGWNMKFDCVESI